MKINDIARIGEREIITIQPGANLSEAIKKLADNHIGALPVCESKGGLIGIISERDIIEWFNKGNSKAESVRVKDVMTTDVIVGLPDDNVEDIVKTMTEQRIRHLPVMREAEVVGILSFRDVIEHQLTECSSQVRYLKDYIAGGYV